MDTIQYGKSPRGDKMNLRDFDDDGDDDDLAIDETAEIESC